MRIRKVEQTLMQLPKTELYRLLSKSNSACRASARASAGADSTDASAAAGMSSSGGAGAVST